MITKACNTDGGRHVKAEQRNKVSTKMVDADGIRSDLRKRCKKRTSRNLRRDSVEYVKFMNSMVWPVSRNGSPPRSFYGPNYRSSADDTQGIPDITECTQDHEIVHLNYQSRCPNSSSDQHEVQVRALPKSQLEEATDESLRIIVNPTDDNINHTESY